MINTIPNVYAQGRDLLNEINDMHGKICLVTGATSGIGKAAATALAALGAEVVISGRNPQKTIDTVQQIKAITGNPAVSYLLADFSDLEQVRTLAAEFKEHYSRLDVLLNDAGAFFLKRKDTPYGVEMTFLVNHLAPFLLTNLLLDTLKESASARIINVSSDSHQFATMNFNDLGFKHDYFGINAYGRSKLANVLFTYELARQLDRKSVTVNAVHPGRVSTDIWKDSFSVFGPTLKYLMSFFSLTPEQGADTVVYLASSKEVEGVTGKYFYKRKAIASSPISYDEATARRLWEISERLTSP